MARRVFYSFHYVPDNWRVSQVRNIGAVEGNAPASDNDWEAVTRRGDKAIQNWIDSQLNGRSCSIVLIGQNTAKRKWINYEIKKTWDDGKGLLGIYIHRLKDKNGLQSLQGSNPFDEFTFTNTGKKMSSIVKAYNPPYVDSKDVYAYISNNLEAWIEVAVKSRNG
jgi:hypothetical protein